MDETAIDTTRLRSDALRELARRGLIAQCTDLDALDARMARGTVTAYIGFDCTAPSLHAGSLVPITLLRVLQRTGHRPIPLLGGGTSKVGDPSDKDEMRPVLSDDQIATNMRGIRAILERFLDRGDGPSAAVFENNAVWLDALGYVPFLREVGRHFTINRMLAFDSVRRRLEREQPMTFLEFNYMILQAYDFVELARRHDCELQMGGSDQWGNIVSGVELGRRLLDRTLYGLTGPLLTTSTGAKMGKTAQGAVWLDPARLAPYDYWQYWRNVEDADAARFLRAFGDLPEDEVARLAALKGQELNETKKVLATELTRIAHGAEAAGRAAESARRTFEQGALGADLPVVDLPRAILAEGARLVEVLRLTGLAASGGEARRLVDAGGARLNDVTVHDALHIVTLADVGADGVIKLSAGRKRHILVRPV
jgi:tyrosyl-tRNA synthetase